MSLATYEPISVSPREITPNTGALVITEVAPLTIRVPQVIGVTADFGHLVYDTGVDDLERAVTLWATFTSAGLLEDGTLWYLVSEQFFVPATGSLSFQGQISDPHQSGRITPAQESDDYGPACIRVQGVL